MLPRPSYIPQPLYPRRAFIQAPPPESLRACAPRTQCNLIGFRGWLPRAPRHAESDRLFIYNVRGRHSQPAEKHGCSRCLRDFGYWWFSPHCLAGIALFTARRAVRIPEEEYVALAARLFWEISFCRSAETWEHADGWIVQDWRFLCAARVYERCRWIVSSRCWSCCNYSLKTRSSLRFFFFIMKQWSVSVGMLHRINEAGVLKCIDTGNILTSFDDACIFLRNKLQPSTISFILIMDIVNKCLPWWDVDIVQNMSI